MKRSLGILTVTTIVVLLGLAGALVAYGASPPATPIPPTPIPTQQDARPVPEFIGHEATPQPINAPPIPRNPHMSTGSWSAHHDDTYMSDTYDADTLGPLGHNSVVSSSFFPTSPTSPFGLVTGITFDQDGRLVAGVVKADLDSNLAWVRLTLIDPATLYTLTWLDLPPEAGAGSSFRPSGTYYYQDDQDRVVIGTSARDIVVISHTDTAPFTFSQEMTYTLAGIAVPDGDVFEALQPDWSGLLWFTSKHGVVGTLDLGTGAVFTMTLPGERIVNGHASDEDGGVYIVSTAALYRFDAAQNGAPSITWRETYDAGTHVKQGQVDIGSGTTPTLMGDDYVAITDNAEPRMHVLVYRRGIDVQGPRLVCAEPVFEPGHTSNENSLVATDRSIVVENNFGYQDPNATRNGRTTKPGLARVDIDDGGNGCHTVWTNMEIHIPTVVTKMSLNNGLIYTYTKAKGPANTDAWYFTAVDFYTGEIVWSRLAGTGDGYNNHYAPVYLGKDGTLYAGVLGGLVSMRDGQ